MICLLFSVPVNGQEDTDTPNPDIASHEILANINPETHQIQVKDHIILTEGAPASFTFSLNKNLEITAINSTLAEWDIEWLTNGDDSSYEMDPEDTIQLVRIVCIPDTNEFWIEYEGEIYDPINPSTALGRVRGDYTSGIISTDGVYLSSETGWYPDTANSMAIFDIEAWVPETWTVVTQGDKGDVNQVGSNMSYKWTSDIPTDGCVLVANEYIVTSRNIEGVECSTYFYQDDPALAASFLDKLEEYLPAYVDLFGPYPYTRFDVVENFFTTGYGMPGFTLLGSQVLRMPFATAEGSLAHELVHNWWGNYVYVDWETGNWCEGLTYFSTNYYWNILDGRPEDAEAFRFRSMVRYALEVSEEEDYPVRQFRTKMTAEDGNIGYDKASGIFIMLHEMLGEEKFFETLRLAVDRFGGQKTSWDDWQAIFEEVYGRDLDDFFTGWLDQTGAPLIGVSELSLQEVGDKYQISFFVNQVDKQFFLNLEMLVDLGTDEINTATAIMSPELYVEIQGPCCPVSIELDPGYYIFRHLTRNEIPPGLKTTLEADSIIVVLPSGGTEDTLEVMGMMGHGGGGAPTVVTVREHFESLANDIQAGMENIVVKYDTEITDDDLANSSILCLGAPRYNSLVGRINPDIDETVAFYDDGFSVLGTEYLDEGNSILVTVRNPYNSDYDITFYMGNSPQAVFKASYIFFYNWDSYVIYQDGTVLNRGDWDMGEGPLFYEFE